MIIGVPKEIKKDENRVALTPAGARELTGAGHRVLIERGAGYRLVDQRLGTTSPTARPLSTAVDDVWSESELVLKVKEPIADGIPTTLRAQEPGALHVPAPGGVSRVHRSPGGRRRTSRSRTRPSGCATTPCRSSSPMSEVAGRMAPLMGAYHLMRPGGGRGTFIGGVPGVAPGERGGHRGLASAGLAAASMAVGLHANVKILDRNLDRLRQVDIHFDGRVQTIASSTLTLEEACLDADIVIGAVLVVGAKAPKLVSNELVSRMRAPGRAG